MAARVDNETWEGAIAGITFSLGGTVYLYDTLELNPPEHDYQMENTGWINYSTQIWVDSGDQLEFYSWIWLKHHHQVQTTGSSGVTADSIMANINVAAVPIPGAILLLGTGLLGLAGLKRM